MYNLAPATVLLMGIMISATAQAQATSFVCNFDTECSQRTGCSTKELSLTFFVDEQGQAYMQGNVDFVQVMPLVGEDAISFVEPAGSGVVQSTSVLNEGQAVHSRHTAFQGEFVTSQWHGQCAMYGGKN
ncbi:hypothetical protein [Tateyamaria sp. SN6-1]|uniref:hypothetical protein n=1 Tax=Tateyamaria sp. SN6-1 TaxID=3092148 RepID=UPI0039F4AAA0